MDEYLNSRHKEVFLRLLTNTADTGGVYLVNLQELVKAHPQSGLLRAMYGRALNENTPIVAGGYFDNRALHKLLYHTDSLLPVDTKQIVVEGGHHSLNGYAAIKDDNAKKAETVAHEPAVTIQESKSEMQTDQPAAHVEENRKEEPAHEIIPPYTEPVTERQEPETVEEEPLGRAPWEMDDEDEEETAPAVAAVTPQQHNLQEHILQAAEPVKEEAAIAPVAADIKHEAAEPTPVIAQRTPWELIAEEYAAQAAHTNGQASHAAPVEAKPENDINEETYDEITGIDEIAITHHTEEITAAETENVSAANTSGTDHFSFGHAFSEYKNGSPVTPAAAEPQPAITAPVLQEGLQLNQSAPGENASHQHDVSKYHDEKMPYTFMWWLDKTRKEHDASYQPYAKAPGNYNHGNKPGKKEKTDNLEHQYIENIFHLSPLDNLTNAAEPQTVEFDMHNKEDRLIKRFITEDPHIHPPLGERLDTENKAKRSSEDDLDMVTETLARIYADQMLFPKAIATYKKLILKFPEKSRYFASRIDALEKRTN